MAQPSLFEVAQPSLFEVAAEAPRPRPFTEVAVERTELGAGAWIDVARGWVTGADVLLARLCTQVPWRHERRVMYDRVVDVPRLQHFVDVGQPLPDPALGELRTALSERYAPELGEPLATVGLCLYRDGHDSVAWHGDIIGRGATEDTVVAIVSLGATRRLALRPRGGGRSLAVALGSGDLLVMGGSCQRTWEHAVPKAARVPGRRVSVQFRPVGVR